MQRIFVAISTLAVAGCTPPSRQVCEAQYRCAGEADPASLCAEEFEQCEEIESCNQRVNVCEAENEALNACILSPEAAAECRGDVFAPTNEDACTAELEAALVCTGGR